MLNILFFSTYNQNRLLKILFHIIPIIFLLNARVFNSQETPNECAIREVKEETGLDVHSLECAGEVDFIYDGYFEKMYIYEITDFSGDIIDCNEGELRWIPIKDIYNYPMWEGDKVFLPLLIKHEPYFRIRLTYENDILINTQKY